MNIYDAMMKAAYYIESHPFDFSFMYGIVPGTSGHKCGTPSCALGWIGHFAQTLSTDYIGVSQELFGIDRFEFYQRLQALTGDKYGFLSGWSTNATDCAKALRLYARKYHAPARRTDSELVADLMRRITTERIPEEA